MKSFTLLVLATTALGGLVLAAKPAQASCSTTWVGGVDNNFGTAGNWSTKSAPGGADDVCITATTTTNPAAVADTYTVVLNGSFSVHSLTLGGANGTQTLVVPAANVQLGLGANSVVSLNGVLTLGDSGGGYSILAGSGTLTNSGHLNTVLGTGAGNTRFLRMAISNAAAGTIDIAAPDTRQDQGTLTSNNGMVMIEPPPSGGMSGALALSGGSSFANNGGVVSNGGAISVNGGTFTQRGGSESGSPVLLSGSTLDDDLGAGAGFFTFTGSGTLTGTGNAPGVAAGQVVTVSAGNIIVALGVDLTNAGIITLGDSNGGYSGLQGPGVLTNNGHLNAVQGSGNTRFFRANVSNGASGIVDISAPDTRQDQGTLTSNNGTVHIEATGGLALSGGSAFANNGGGITNDGAFGVSGGTFTQRGGTESGNAVLLSGSTLDDDLMAAAGFFTFTGNGTLTGTGSKPGVAAGQVVTLSAANIFVALGVDLTNAGMITLGDSGGGFSILRGTHGALTNSGQLNTVKGPGGGNTRYLRVDIINAPGGTVDIAAPDTRQDASDVGATTFINNGAVTTEAAGSLALSGGSSFVNNGAVSNSGGFGLSGGTFTQRGTESGNAVVLTGSILDDDTSAGGALFDLAAGSNTLTGSGSNPGVAAGQTVTIAANNTDTIIAKDLTNAGTITLGDSGGGFSILRGTGSVLTNNGRLNTVQGAGGGNTRYLRVNINNSSDGTVDIGAPDSRQDQGTLTTNNGTFKIDAPPPGGVGGAFALSGGSSFANTGGAVNNNGTVSISGGTFTQRGGTESGTAVLLSGSTLDDDLGAGAGLFTFTGNGTLTGSGSKPGVAAGQVVTIGSFNIFVGLGVNLTNAGTVTLGDGNGGYSVLQGPGALTNNGHLNTVQGPGGGNTRFLRVNVNNAAAGTIEIAAPDTRQDQGTLTSNDGTVQIEAAGDLVLSGGSTFGQSASGTFATTINANVTTFGKLTGAGSPVSLDGKLLVTTLGSPTIGSSWPIISGANRSGQFATLEFDGQDYDVQYTAAGVTLVAIVTPTPTVTVTPLGTNTPTNVPTVTATSASTSAASPTLTATPPATSTASPNLTPTVTVTQTAPSTSTATDTPNSTATPTSTVTGTVTSTPTPQQTTSPSPSPTGARFTIPGTVLGPGARALVPIANQAVDLFTCATASDCLMETGGAYASTVSDLNGRFAFSLPIEIAEAKVFVLLQAIVDGVKCRQLLTPRLVSLYAGITQAIVWRAADITDASVDPIAEAAVRVLAAQGIDNFSADGIEAVIAAVQAANSDTSFDGLGVADANDTAEMVANNDPTVQMVLQTEQFTPAPTATVTPTPTPAPCIGDCGGNGQVSIDEILTMVDIALGAPSSTCEAGDANHDGQITVDEILTAVDDALNGCPAA